MDLLGMSPRLQSLFGPLSACIKQGDLAGFDDALTSGEGEFVKRRIYLTLERGRDIALRNLFRKVFIAGGFDETKEGEENAPKIRRTRIPITEFEAAMRLGMGTRQEVPDREEVECLVANLIYKVCLCIPAATSPSAWTSWATDHMRGCLAPFLVCDAPMHCEPNENQEQPPNFNPRIADCMLRT
jgi:hypothetical protein